MKTDKNNNKYYKIALHLHSTLSDGKKTPEEIAKEYKADGFDAIALTDHWVYGEEREIAGLPIISGCEYNLGAAETKGEGVIHILGLGMKRDPKIERSYTREEIVKAIRDAGGLAVLAHPAWSLNTPDELVSLPGIEATEIYNAVSESHSSMRPYSDYFADICANKEVYPALLATDDAHYYDGTDNRKGWICARLDELSTDSILEAIRNRDFYASEGPELYARREGNKIIIDTSPVSIIGSLSNLSWAPERTLRGEDLTHWEYEIKELEEWVRIEAVDKNGRRAFTNFFVI